MTVSPTDPVCAVFVSAKLAVSPALVLADQQDGVPGLYWSSVSTEALATPLVPGGAGGTAGAVTAGWTGPPITWLTVSIDTFWVCSQVSRALKFAGLTEYWLQSLSQMWWKTSTLQPPPGSAWVTNCSIWARVQSSWMDEGARTPYGSFGGIVSASGHPLTQP